MRCRGEDEDTRNSCNISTFCTGKQPKHQLEGDDTAAELNKKTGEIKVNQSLITDQTNTN
ncbi:hypothetical protein OIU79_000437 [Salix purpurea]|uniref:Uncharacterized protein n=1 Tax=Salix purpurea TaxID=77065 RepID=A0A9Q0ZMV2_SALPP|nr:hypothetical protein OIU79_000437 [Salix purpurea]